MGSQKHQLNVTAIENGKVPAVADDETDSVMSSTFSLGEPVNMTPAESAGPLEPATDTVDLEAEVEFSKVVNGIKETTITDEEPVSRRPTRPHHSAGEQRSPHPLSAIKKEEEVISTSEVAAKPAVGSLPQCLFCNYASPSFKLNVHHMTKFHGMFIPEQAYLVDLEGLIEYLHKKIIENHECLHCHKLKGSTSGIQTHMRDKGHCMIAFESEEEMIEVGQFYNFSSTYSDQDEDEEMVDGEEGTSGGVKLGCPRAAKIIVSDENGDQEMGDPEAAGEGWETDSEDGEANTENLSNEPSSAPEKPPPNVRRPSLLTAGRRYSAIDDYCPNPRSPSRAAFTSEYELHLPSGRTAGHRSLARYFRQNLHSYPTPTERLQQQQLTIEEGASSGSDEEMALAQPSERGRQLATRADGGLGMLGVTDAKKNEVKAVEKRETKRAQREMRDFQWGVNKKGNQQKHFRDPLLQ